MPRLLIGSSAIALVLGIGSCGDGATEPPGADPTMSAPSPTPPTETPTEPTVAPATGALLTSEVASVNAPADYTGTPLVDSSGGVVSASDARYNVGLSDNDITLDNEALNAVARLSQRACCYRPPLTRQPDTTVAGEPAYHLAGRNSIFGTWAEEFSLRHEGHTIKITVNTPLDLPQAERGAIAAPVLASVTLTE